MTYTIFYSWQSDLPNSANRGFIQNALEIAVKNIRSDSTIEVEPVIDRDTADVPGSPDIASTIMEKISQASIFICDVSIINNNQNTPGKDGFERLVPNPNVLIELGYAIKALGSDHVIMVMNTEYGKPEDLPFDLKMKRIVSYRATPSSNENPSARKELASILEARIRQIITLPTEKPDTKLSDIEIAIAAVTENSDNQIKLIKKAFKILIEDLISLSPDYQYKDNDDELLVQAINSSIPWMVNIFELAECIADNGKNEAVLAFYQGFELLLAQYNNPLGFSGHFHSAKFDFYYFISDELFVSLVAMLMKRERWDDISSIFETPIYRENPESGIPRYVTYEGIPYHVGLLAYRQQRLAMNVFSLHAKILMDRHSMEPLVNFVSKQEFIDADFFIFLRNGSRWHGWSLIYLADIPPRFISKMVLRKFAEKTLKPLNVTSIHELQNLVTSKRKELIQDFQRANFYDPFPDFNCLTIGTN